MKMQEKLRKIYANINSPANFAKTIIVSIVFLKVIGFVFNKIFFVFLNQAEYGSYTFIITFIGTLAAITSIGIPSYILRYCTDTQRDPDRLKNGEIIFTGLSLNILFDMFVIAVLLMGILVFEFDFLNTIDWYLLFLIGLLLFFQQLKSAIITYSTTNQISISYFFFTIGPSLLLIFLGILFAILLDLRVPGLILALFLSEGIVGLFGSNQIKKIAKPSFPSFIRMKNIFNYGLPIYVVILAFNLYNFGLYYLTGISWGTEELTLFAAAFSVANLIGIFRPLFQIGFKSITFQLYEKNLDIKLNEFTTQSLKTTMIFFFPILATIYFLSPELVTLFSREEYIIAIPLIPFLLSKNFIQFIKPFVSLGPSLKKRTRLSAFINIISIILATIFALFAIPLFGFVGMGMSLLVYELVDLIMQIPWSQHLYKFHYDLQSIFTIIISLLISSLFTFVIGYLVSLHRIILLAAFFLFYFILLLVSKELNKSDILFIKKLVRIN